MTPPRIIVYVKAQAADRVLFLTGWARLATRERATPMTKESPPPLGPPDIHDMPRVKEVKCTEGRPTLGKKPQEPENDNMDAGERPVSGDANSAAATTLVATMDDAPDASGMSNETPPAVAPPTTPANFTSFPAPPPFCQGRKPVKPNTKAATLKFKSISTLESEITATEAKLAATLSRLSASQSSSSQSRGRTVGLKRAEEGDITSSPVPPPPTKVTSTAGEKEDEDDQSLPSLDNRQQLLHHAQGIFDRHIVLLKKYNEIKDVAMGMLSLIADKEGKRLAEVMQERGLVGDD